MSAIPFFAGRIRMVMYKGFNRLRMLPLPVRITLLALMIAGKVLVHAVVPSFQLTAILEVIVVAAGGLLLPMQYAVLTAVLCSATAIVLSHGDGSSPLVRCATWSLNALFAVLIAVVLRESVRRLAQLEAAAATTSTGIFMMNEEGYLLYANRAAARLLGCEPSELVGRWAGELLEHQNKPDVGAVLRKVLQGDEILHHAVLTTRSGNPLGVTVSLSRLVVDDELSVVGFLHAPTAQDLSGTLFRAAFDAIQAAAAVRTPDGRIVVCNEAYAASLGTTPGELVGTVEMPYGLPQSYLPEVLEALRRGESPRREYVTPEGRTIGLTLYPIRDPAGPMTGSIGLAQDITYLAEAQGRLARAERLATTGQLSAGIAHNINNILTVISTNAELLQLSPAHAGKATADIVDAVERGSALVRSLLDLAAGKSRLRLELVRLTELAGSVLSMVDVRLSRQQVAVQLELPPDLVITTDSGILHQALLNLILNALQVMPQNGRLTLGAALECGTIRIWVSDTGPGIPPEHRDQIFQPFFTTKENLHGTGLGLPTSLALVRALGGEIEMSSTPGVGTTFTVLLPCSGPEKSNGAADE